MTALEHNTSTPSTDRLRCEFCGQFMRRDGKGHEACLREYDRSINPNG